MTQEDAVASSTVMLPDEGNYFSHRSEIFFLFSTYELTFRVLLQMGVAICVALGEVCCVGYCSRSIHLHI